MIKDYTDVLLVLATIISFCHAGFIGGNMRGRATERHKYQTEAKEHGFANHNSETGEWQWKDVKEVRDDA